MSRITIIMNILERSFGMTGQVTCTIVSLQLLVCNHVTFRPNDGQLKNLF